MMKRFATVVIAATMMIGGIGMANAQTHGFHGGSSGGASHGGGSWHGGGGNWHGGGSWHGGHSHVIVGVGFGAPYWGWGWWPGYYYPYGYASYYPYYYDYPYGYDYGYSGTYIQQGAPAPAAVPPARGEYSPSIEYSYYCPDPAGFYPQVPTCAKGWLRVLPPSAPGPTGPTTY